MGVGEMVLNLRAETAAFSKGLDRARGDLRRFHGDIETAAGAGLSIAAVAGGLRLIRTAIDVAGASIAAWQGDWEGVDKIVRGLPFGIGAIATAIDDAVNAATGFGKALAEIEVHIKQLREAAKGRETIGGIVDKLETEMKLLRAPAGERAGLKIHLEAQAKAQEIIKAGGTFGGESRDVREGLWTVRGWEIAQRTVQDAEKMRGQAEAQAEANRKRTQETKIEALNEYAKATMSDRDYLHYQVEQLNLAADAAKYVYSTRLAILNLSKQKTAAEVREKFRAESTVNLEDLRNRAREDRGEIDALGLEQEQVLAGLGEAFAAGTIEFGEFAQRVAEVSEAYKELRRAGEKAIEAPETMADKPEPVRSLAGIVTDRLTRAGLGGGGTLTPDAKAIVTAVEKTTAAVKQIEEGGGLG